MLLPKIRVISGSIEISLLLGLEFGSVSHRNRIGVHGNIIEKKIALNLVERTSLSAEESSSIVKRLGGQSA